MILRNNIIYSIFNPAFPLPFVCSTLLHSLLIQFFPGASTFREIQLQNRIMDGGVLHIVLYVVIACIWLFSPRECYYFQNDNEPTYLVVRVGHYVLLNCAVDFQQAYAVPYMVKWRKDVSTNKLKIFKNLQELLSAKQEVFSMKLIIKTIKQLLQW